MKSFTAMSPSCRAQSLGQLTAMDFIVTLTVGDLFDDIFWLEVPIVQGPVAFAIIMSGHRLVTFISSRNKHFYRLVTSSESLLIEEGRLVQESLQRERMRTDDVQSQLRLKGEEHPGEIKQAWLEPSGQTSVIKKPSNKPVKKRDKDLLS